MKKILVLLGIAAMVAGCGQSYEEKARISRAERERLAREDAQALKVAVMPTIDCMPAYLAKSAAWFDSMGVDIRLKVRNAQMDCDTALAGKSVEVAVTDLKRVEHLTRRGVALVSMGPTNAYWQLIANRTARVKDVSQMGDKMVAMTRYSATDYLTDQALKGVKTSSVVFRIQINDVLTRLEMLRNNEMDAMWLPEPQATTARMYKHVVLKDSRKMNQHLGVVVMRGGLFSNAERKRQLAAFVKGYNRACDSLNVRGVAHYSSLVETYCHTDGATVKALPKLYFPHIALKNIK